MRPFSFSRVAAVVSALLVLPLAAPMAQEFERPRGMHGTPRLFSIADDFYPFMSKLVQKSGHAVTSEYIETDICGVLVAGNNIDCPANLVEAEIADRIRTAFIAVAEEFHDGPYRINGIVSDYRPKQIRQNRSFQWQKDFDNYLKSDIPADLKRREKQLADWRKFHAGLKPEYKDVSADTEQKLMNELHIRRVMGEQNNIATGLCSDYMTSKLAGQFGDTTKFSALEGCTIQPISFHLGKHLSNDTSAWMSMTLIKLANTSTWLVVEFSAGDNELVFGEPVLFRKYASQVAN